MARSDHPVDSTDKVQPAVNSHALPALDTKETNRLRDSLQEVRELGIGQTISRAVWEVKTRSGLGSLLDQSSERAAGSGAKTNGSELRIAPPGAAAAIQNAVPFIDPERVVAVMTDRIFAEEILSLRRSAVDAVHGRILSFGRRIADFGRPIDWHLNPINGRRWPASVHWSKAVKDTRTIGDVKLTWEPGRFPQAYLIARTAAFTSDLESELAAALTDQIQMFVRNNPVGHGIHWNSGQELAIRLMAWAFSINVLLRLGQTVPECVGALLNGAYEYGTHIERNLNYAKTVANNHLISEALGLLLAGHLLPDLPEAERWRANATTILDREATRQAGSSFAEDSWRH